MVSSESNSGFRFLDSGADLGDAATVEKYYKALESRPLDSVDTLEAWLLDQSELDGWLDEEGSIRYVEMTCQTDSAEHEKRYLSFIEDVVPVAKKWANKLDRKFLDCEHHTDLPRDRYEVLVRQIRNRVELFREENIPLQTEDEKLRQQYQKVVGAMTIEKDDREITMQEASRYLEEQDREVRREVWEKLAIRWRLDREEIEGQFDKMVSLRHRIANNAGFPDYREYMFREMERFDYTPADCEAFADAIEKIIVPQARKLGEERKSLLGLDVLRPWDMSVDPKGREPLRPFETVDQLVAGCRTAFEQVEPDFGVHLAKMEKEGLLDLQSRKGKAPGGYMMEYKGRRLPFIFMNAVGTHNDVRTLLHEGGHAFHVFAASGEKIAALRDAPIEFAEVASMSMELLAGRNLEAMYDEAAIGRSFADHLRGVLHFFPYMAMVDMLQHWAYTHPKHTRDERKTRWVDLNNRFADWVDYTDYEDVQAYSWHRKNHPFVVPFYYVEYGIAQLGALGVWRNSQTDKKSAVKAYRNALALGGRRPLPELFETANVPFDFTAKVIEPAVKAIENELALLGD